MRTLLDCHPRRGRIGPLRALVVVLAVTLGAPAAGTKPAAAATD
jgi:hypothetical protein